MLKTKRKINSDCEASVECARDKKNEYINLIEETFNKIFEDVTKQKQKVNRTIDENLGDIDVCLVQLKSIKETINETTISDKEIDEKFEIFREIEREVDKKASTVMGYTYSQYNDGNASADDVQRICGYLAEMEVLPEMLRTCSIVIEDGGGTQDVDTAIGRWKGNTRCRTIVSFGGAWRQSGCGNGAIFGAKKMRAFREMRHQSEKFLRKQLKSFKQIRNIANIKKISLLCSRKNY